MSSSGSEQGYRGPELHQGCNQVRIITLYWSGNADSQCLSWSVWISELWQVRGYCSWSIAARPRHGCSRRLQIGARAGTMFLIRVLELGLIALMISSEIVLSCRWDWILALAALESSRDVLCLSWLNRFRIFLSDAFSTWESWLICSYASWCLKVSNEQ